MFELICGVRVKGRRSCQGVPDTASDALETPREKLLKQLLRVATPCRASGNAPLSLQYAPAETWRVNEVQVQASHIGRGKGQSSDNDGDTTMASICQDDSDLTELTKLSQQEHVTEPSSEDLTSHLRPLRHRRGTDPPRARRHSNISQAPMVAAAPMGGSWDWPLTRHEKKTRIVMLDFQELMSDREQLQKELTDLMHGSTMRR